MRNWIKSLVELAAARSPVVLLTVTSVRGSAPRETGASMIVTSTESIGTIGGGQLEFQCVQIACEQLKDLSANNDCAITRKFVLGANCGQCCGGVVEVMFEYLAPTNIEWINRIAESYRNRESVILASRLRGPVKKIVVASAKCHAEEPCPDDVATAARQMLADAHSARVVGDYLLTPIRYSDFQIAVFGAGHVGTSTLR